MPLGGAAEAKRRPSALNTNKKSMRTAATGSNVNQSQQRAYPHNIKIEQP